MYPKRDESDVLPLKRIIAKATQNTSPKISQMVCPVNKEKRASLEFGCCFLPHLPLQPSSPALSSFSFLFPSSSSNLVPKLSFGGSLSRSPAQCVPRVRRDNCARITEQPKIERAKKRRISVLGSLVKRKGTCDGVCRFH